jgi:type I restriction enzyme R subunit
MALLRGLEDKGFGRTQLADIQRLIAADKLGYLRCTVLHCLCQGPDAQTRTRGRCTSGNSEEFNEKQQAFLNFVLSHYVEQGVEELDPSKVAALITLRYMSSSDAMLDLGPPSEIRRLFLEFLPALYPGPKTKPERK